MNNNQKKIFIVFSFQQNKQYPNAHYILEKRVDKGPRPISGPFQL